MNRFLEKYIQIFIIFAILTYDTTSPPTGGFGVHGRLTEWLGSGLQNHLRRFEPTEQSEGARDPAKRGAIRHLEEFKVLCLLVL